MNISLRWLQDFVAFNENEPQTIADLITAHTAEVEGVEELGKYLENCYVGKILSVESHPNADRLSLCEVQTNKGVKKVVCGGTNLRSSMKVAFAHIGATVSWHGEEEMTLEPVKIRGEQSEGMICAAEELGLHSYFPESVDTVIIDLGSDDEGIGKTLKEYLNIDDIVIDIDNHSITHRPDLFSQIGFARECQAIGIAKWKSAKAPSFNLSGVTFPKTPLPFKVNLEAKKLVPRYMACLIEIDDLGETPEFIKSRINSVGWRSINLPVDITNFVSSEIGMPLHSFDADDLKGDIHLRQTKTGETITTLDEEARELPEGALVISDDEGIFDLLGVMGGLRTSTTEKTRRIYLHSALVDPINIRRTIVATGHRTEAATVYEKGIAPVTVEQGFARALQLFLEYVPGARVVSVLDSYGEEGTRLPVSVSVSEVNSLLGTSIPAKDMVHSLEALGCNVKIKDEVITVTPPLFRNDLLNPQDIIEEIGRMYGFNNIQPVMPSTNMNIPERDFRLKSICEELRLKGYFECVPLSILGPDLLKKSLLNPLNSAEIENPIGEELSLMQPSTLPRLLEHAEENLSKSSTNILKTFHVGRVFSKTKDLCTEMGLLLSSSVSDSIKDSPFYILKRDITESFAKVGYKLSISPAKNIPSFAHTGRCASLCVCGECIGTIFEVHPDICTEFSIPSAAAVTLDINALLDQEPEKIISFRVSQFPAVKYDVTLQADHSGSMEDKLNKMRSSSSLLESLTVQDIYSGQSLPEGKFNITFRFIYRSQEKTLTEEEVRKEHSNVMKTIEDMIVVG